MIRIQRLGLFLEAHFGEVEYHMPDEEQEPEEEELASHGEPSFLIQLDDAEARINLLSMVRPSHFILYFFPPLMS
jgi:cleavage and polyadenylation specificity factor subunit 3